MEGGGGHLQAHALLLVLLQSQRIDGEERHVGLQDKETGSRLGLYNQWEQQDSEINVLYLSYAVFGGLVQSLETFGKLVL